MGKLFMEFYDFMDFNDFVNLYLYILGTCSWHLFYFFWILNLWRCNK